MAIVPILRIFNDIERELLRAPPVLTAEQIGFIQSPAFTQHSAEWARLRYDFLRDHEALCQCCGRGPANDRKINVDHIYPRRTHPQFALTYANLQVLCSTCNQGKGNRDRTDWRFRQRNPRALEEPDKPPCPVCQAPMQHRSGARVSQSIGTRVSQAQRVIQLAVSQQPSVGGDRRTAELQQQTPVEIEPQSALVRFTRRVRHPRLSWFSIRS